MDVYIVTGEVRDHANVRQWLVRAFSNKDKAHALSDRLNAWCKENDCHADTDADVEGRRTHEAHDREVTFHRTWWEKNGLPHVPWDDGYMIDVPPPGFEMSIRFMQACDRMREAYVAESVWPAMTTGRKVPLEDPLFSTSHAGTQYFVETVPHEV